MISTAHARTLRLIVASALLPAISGCFIVAPGNDGGDRGDGNGNGGGALPGIGVQDGVNFTHTLLHRGQIRRYYVHTPRGWDGRSPLAVVLNFHGGLSNPQTQAEASQMNDLADAEDFLVVYPEGTAPGPNLLLEQYTWNAGKCCGSASENDVDDVGFVAELLDRLPTQYPVDEDRIYATGMSNGGMMAHRIGVELADRIAAIAPVAGALQQDDPPAPSRPVPVLHFHGLLDENAPFDGGQSQNEGNPVEQNSVPYTISYWVDENDCDPTPTITEFDDYVEDTYEPAGANGAPVRLIVLPEGGHTWPGGVDVTANLNTGPLVESVDASAMMWQFFEQFSRSD